MTLELLLIGCLAINIVTLTISFYTLRRYQKIVKLSNLIYDQLIITRTFPDEKPHEAIDFNSRLMNNLKKAEGTLENITSVNDPLLAKVQALDEKTHKGVTKAESHLVKVLQAKYSLNDDQDPQPAGN